MNIELLDGTIIEGYPKEKADNAQSQTIQEEEGRLFTDNAFLFLSNAGRILADSRMFLAPIHGIKSSIAYTGRISQPTLGVYIEWWLSCLDAMQHKAARCMSAPVLRPEHETGQWLLFLLAGWPTTDTNFCGMVNVSGERRSGGICDFYGAWRALAKINRRYAEAKSACQAYTLREVLDILKAEERTIDSKVIDIAFLINRVRRLEGDVDYYMRRAEAATAELHEHLVLSRADEIEQAISDLEEQQELMHVTIASIDTHHKLLRQRMKAGEITNVEYQKAWHPLHKLCDDVWALFYEKQHNTEEQFFDGRISVSQMKSILKKHKQKVIGEIVGGLVRM